MQERILGLDQVQQLVLLALQIVAMLGFLFLHFVKVVKVGSSRELVASVFELFAALFAPFNHCLLC